MKKEATYKDVAARIATLVEGETDPIAVMSTICCEVFQSFDHFNWVGYYRLVDEHTLKVGPYQGTHGCLSITLDRGVCGKCAREGAVQLVNDVSAIPHHIACSSETKAELVLPVRDAHGKLTAVFDIDSIAGDCFDEVDVRWLEEILGACIEGRIR